ncbi:MAG: hypothetical protein ACLGJC_05115, partial [Alphaproteobacteria bacterium]
CNSCRWPGRRSRSSNLQAPLTSWPPDMLSKPNERAVALARQHLDGGNPGGFARAIAAAHRASDLKQQKALDAVIAETETEHLFGRRNGALVAIE